MFSEIYGCYYQVLDQILARAEQHPVTGGELAAVCQEQGFAESSLYILPKLTGGEWHLLTREGDQYRALTRGHRTLPLTRLQRSFVKSLLPDPRFRLFFTDEELSVLRHFTEDVEPLWKQEDFHYYDRYTDDDPFDDPDYQTHFRTILAALSRRQYVNLSYQSGKGNRISHHYLPLKLEYSAKNDRFRLLAVPEREKRSPWIHTLNLQGIRKAVLLSRLETEDFDFEQMIRRSYYKEPLRLQIRNRRNALERAMLHFSNYEKKTRKIDEDTWECLIYYNRSMETELLIEVLSFGPAIKVMGPDAFIDLVRERLDRQMELFSRFGTDGNVTSAPS
ncbi:MAG: WYL domain-containing protein [Lachnospiraceae bacterium]|nr:WYL domain-containing protein [Lachnospiraceae bacterium]